MSNQFQSFSSTAVLNYVAKTHADTGYTFTSTNDFVLWTLTNASNDTAVIPAANANAGKLFRVKLAAMTASANTLTVGRSGSDTFTLADGTTGATSLVMQTPGEEYEIVSDGTSVWQVLNHRTVTISTVYTPTYNSAWAVTNPLITWRRVGDRLFVTGFFNISSTAANTALITLPTNLTVDLAKLGGAQLVGWYADATNSSGSIVAAGQMGVVFCDGSTTSSLFFARSVAANTFTKATGAALTAANDAWTFNFDVPISGWVA